MELHYIMQETLRQVDREKSIFRVEMWALLEISNIHCYANVSYTSDTWNRKPWLVHTVSNLLYKCNKIDIMCISWTSATCFHETKSILCEIKTGQDRTIPFWEEYLSWKSLEWYSRENCRPFHTYSCFTNYPRKTKCRTHVLYYN